MAAKSKKTPEAKKTIKSRPQKIGTSLGTDSGSAQSSHASWVRILLWAISSVTVLLTIFARLRLLDLPLERDEGEYAYIGQLILQGIPPFRLASNMKLPGTGAAYALGMAFFGQTAAGVHLGFLIVNLGTIVLLFFLGRRLFNESAGLAAAASYALMAIGLSVLGTSAHATHFVVLPALGATLLLLYWENSRSFATLFWCGLLYGVAVMMKQPGAMFAIFGTFYLAWMQRRDFRPRWKIVLLRFGLFGFAGLLPLATTALILWRAGVFPRFWFWTVTYAQAYGSIVPFATGVQVFKEAIGRIIGPNWPLWLLAAIGVALPWFQRRSRTSVSFVMVFLACSFLGVCPGFYFREHYFVLMLPVIALLVGAAVSCAQNLVPPAVPVFIFAASLLIAIIPQREFLFELSSTQISRLMYGPNPFLEMVNIGTYLREHTTKDVRIAVLGSEPELYFYADRHSSTDYLYTYPMVEAQPLALQMQNEMIRDIEAVRPDYIVMVNVSASWLVRDGAPKRLFDWWEDYAPRYYERIGVADIVSSTNTIYQWDAAAQNYSPRSPYFLLVLKRKS